MEKKFPNAMISLEDEEIKRFYIIFHKKLYQQGKIKNQ